VRHNEDIVTISLRQVTSYETHSEDETIDLGRRIAAELPSRAVVLLIGNLGAGKTTLAKGIVSGLGAAAVEDVSSPTFTLIHEYGDRVYHIDLYRIDTPRQLETLGLDDLITDNSILLIEWGEKFARFERERENPILLALACDFVLGPLRAVPNDPADPLTEPVPSFILGLRHQKSTHPPQRRGPWRFHTQSGFPVFRDFTLTPLRKTKNTIGLCT
jgi:tRNA threonylcarbamoyladenosine biosynthesis protein TsaE